MRYREIKPTNSLVQFVECFWILENDGISEPIKSESILPDGCVELILTSKGGPGFAITLDALHEVSSG